MVIRMRIVKIVIVQHRKSRWRVYRKLVSRSDCPFSQAFGRCGKRLVRRRCLEMKKRKKIE